MKQTISTQKEAKALMKKRVLKNEDKKEKLPFKSFDRRKVIEYLQSVANQCFTEEYILDYSKGGIYLSNERCTKGKSKDCINKQLDEEQPEQEQPDEEQVN